MHQAVYQMCFQQRKCLWNKLIQAEVFWFRRDQYVMKVTSVLLVPPHQSVCFLSRPVEEHMDFKSTYGGAVFTSLTLLTSYQIASCVRLQCWREKRPFPRLRSLDSM
jgi:hypothetical protein